ncbi:MAG: amidase [Hyphomicrobiales bacterium]|nr:amidase [Hyphomicrobiales bacterium]OQW84865.1 MAG: hypothetical protein BVN31_02060 [Proteobacteria bacterium ST_bin15]
MPPKSPSAVLPLLKRIEEGQITANAAFESYAQVISASEPMIKAFAHLDIESARRQVGASSQQPLKGLPVAIKDVFETSDMPTAFGSEIYASNRPPADAAIVMLSRKAGATIIGKTTTTAFAHLDPTMTENPVAPGHTPGGSSAGSAAAVAGGMVPFAVGTQTGGSVVRPASYCGIAGYKPSYRLLPTVGLKHFSWFLDTVGVFAPTVADAAFFAGALTGRPLRVDGVNAAPPSLGIIDVPDWGMADKSIGEAVMAVVTAAERAGSKIVAVGNVAVLHEAWEAHAAIQMFESAMALAFEYERYRERLPPLVRGELDAAQKIGFAEYDEARAIASRARREMKRIFGALDVLVQPAAPGPPPATLASTGRAVFNRLWTMTGDPAISVPGMRDSAGLPLGVQVIGPFGEDHKTLAAAHFIEGVIARLH